MHHMPPKTASHDSIALRLTEILRRLNEGEKLNPTALVEEFGVTLRTIQRDLNERFAFLELEKKDGCYSVNRLRLGSLSMADVQRFASLAGLQGLHPRLSTEFLRDILDSRIQNTLLVRGHNYEELDGKEALFKCKVHAVKAPKAAEIDDELAKKFGAEDLAALKGQIAERLEAEYKGAARAVLKRALLDQLDGLVKFDLPSKLVEAEASQIAHQLWHEENPDVHDHNHGHVEGLDAEGDPLLVGESIAIGEDIEHSHAGESDVEWAKTHPKRPGTKN